MIQFYNDNKSVDVEATKKRVSRKFFKKVRGTKIEVLSLNCRRFLESKGQYQTFDSENFSKNMPCLTLIIKNLVIKD
jgi:hypothetical protein